MDKERLMGILRRGGKALDELDRRLGYRERIPVADFVKHLREGEITRVEITVCNNVDYTSGGGSSWGSDIPIPVVYYYQTEYRSYDGQGRYLELSVETHASHRRLSRDFDGSNRDRVRHQDRNLLSAVERANELQELLPGLEVMISAPGVNGPSRAADELRERGLTPFDLTSLELALPKEV